MTDTPLSIISVQPRLRKGWKRDGVEATRREFSDFIIAGRSLLDIVGDDYMTPFVRGHGKTNREIVERFLAPPGEDPVAIYICPECGDIGCGAILTRIRRQDGYVIWDRLTWDNEIYDAIYDGARESFAARALGPFRFESAAYEAAIRAAGRI